MAGQSRQRVRHPHALYARHFAAFDLLPIWSSVDAGGFGSPMPLMYHKLFFMIAGLLSVAGLSLKSADVVALWLFLVAGAAGLGLTVRALGGSRLAAAIAGCSLITANYTVTNWLVRGAVAEFSGAMVTAWALLFFVRSLQAGRMHPGLGVGARSVVAGAFGARLLRRTARWRQPGLLLAAAGAAPWSMLNPRTGWRAVACSRASSSRRTSRRWRCCRAGYDFNRILIPYQPVNEFRPVPRLLLGASTGTSARTVSGLTVQLDHAMLALLIVSARRAGDQRACAPRPPAPDTIVRAALPFLILAAFGMLLQLPVSSPFYLWMPGAAFLQFPWRLLALITPALIVAAVFLGRPASPGRWPAVHPGHVPRPGWLPAAALRAASGSAFAIDPPQMAGVSFSSPYREYEPRTAPPLVDIRVKLAARWSDAGCVYNRAAAEAEVTVDAVSNRRAAGRRCCRCRSTHPPCTRCWRRRARRQPCLVIPEFPDLCGAAIPAGDGEVSVALPTMASLVRSLVIR